MEQVAMRNSAWRRRALVSNCACKRLESTTRTPMASEVADDGVIKRCSQLMNRWCPILGKWISGSQGWTSHNRGTSFKSGIENRVPGDCELILRGCGK